MGLTAKDIEFDKLERDKNAFVIFEVNNPEAVQKFMDNKELQDFLTSDIESDGAKRGCRLTIKFNKSSDQNVKSTLMIGRQLKPTTDIPVASAELARTISTFIYPPSQYNYNGLYDMTAGLSAYWRDRFGKQPYTPEEAYEEGVNNIKKDNWSRAQKFLLPSKLEVSSKQGSDKKSDSTQAKKI